MWSRVRGVAISKFDRYYFWTVKQAGPSRQLFETVNFAFMKISDFLIKTALFGVILLFLDDLCHKLRQKIELDCYIIRSFIQHQPRFSAVIYDANHRRKVERPQKRLF